MNGFNIIYIQFRLIMIIQFEDIIYIKIFQIHVYMTYKYGTIMSKMNKKNGIQFYSDVLNDTLLC